MLSKNTISEIRQLHQKKFREEQGRFLVEGNKSVLELLSSDWQIEVLICEEGWLKDHQKKIQGKTDTIIATSVEMERISSLKTPQPVLAIAHLPRFSTADILASEPLLVLDSIRDPGNLGTIIRTTDWFGIRQILCSPDTVEFSNPKTVQASMGSFTRVKVIYHDLETYLASLNGERPVLGTFTDGVSIREMAFEKNAIVMIGNESQGISKRLHPFITQKIAIPSGNGGETESLNASMAAGIVMYAWSKQ